MEEDSKFSYEKETSRLAGMATFRFGSTLCKFHPGFGGKFMYFITLNILYFVDNKAKRNRAENLHLPVMVQLRN